MVKRWVAHVVSVSVVVVLIWLILVGMLVWSVLVMLIDNVVSIITISVSVLVIVSMGLVVLEGSVVGSQVHWHLVADVNMSVLDWLVPLAVLNRVVWRLVVRLSSMVQVALMIVLVMDGALVPLLWLNISL